MSSRFPWGKAPRAVPVNSDALREIAVFRKHHALPEHFILRINQSLWDATKLRLDGCFRRIHKAEHYERQKVYGDIAEIIFHCSGRLPRHLASLIRMIGHRFHKYYGARSIFADELEFIEETVRLCNSLKQSKPACQFLEKTAETIYRIQRRKKRRATY